VLAGERQAYILRKLAVRPAISAAELAGELGCSRSTIQRDLRSLAERGEVERQFGGAMRPHADTIVSSFNESVLDEKLAANARPKSLIAARALDEVEDGSLVFIDSGSTPLFLLPGLADKRVIVVTNSVAVISRLAGAQVEAYLLGGSYQPRYQATMGAITVREIRDFRFDRALMGANGVDLELGEVFVSEYQIGEIKRSVIERAKRSILMVDQAKFEYTGVCRYAMLDDFDRVYVDRLPPGQPAPANFAVVGDGPAAGTGAK
jgi:DeoR family fructose operon transcriptional repressor